MVYEAMSRCHSNKLSNFQVCCRGASGGGTQKQNLLACRPGNALVPDRGLGGQHTLRVPEWWISSSIRSR